MGGGGEGQLINHDSIKFRVESIQNLDLCKEGVSGNVK